MRRAILLALGVVALAGCGGDDSTGGAPSAASGYRFVQFATGVESPVHASAPRSQPGRLYVVEQEGRIRILRNGRVTGTLLDIRSQVGCCGEQGLLSVAFHPRYAQNGKYYVDFTDRRGDTRVVEYRGSRRLRQILFVDQPYSNHNGGQLAFGPDGRLYVGMGDGGGGGDPENRAQNLGSRLGKLLAINVDRRGARPQIVGYGLRNPWRFSFDRKTGDLYIGDVGQNSWEEVDFTPRRSPGLENYGWDVYEGRARFEDKPPNPRGRLVFPVTVYSLNGDECAVTGGFVYRGEAVPSAVGRYFFGDNCSGAVWSFRISRGRARGLRKERFTLGGLSSFGEDAAGELYAVTLGGRVYQLRSG
ncbi:MAG TPA: PQQ-dependent sugar dehydrogenase [Gaiellaceae bacterium]|nr:PQQ-dependent sugar dehydrogenase [Gaiellaceae bacterium]